MSEPWELTDSGAVLSSDRQYRYALWRIWDRKRRLICMVCLNGSNADETHDDHSVRKFIGFCNTLDAGGLLVGNAFAFRTPYPKVLRKADYPIGDNNDDWIRRLSSAATASGGITIVAWGNHGAHLHRSGNLTGLFSEPVYCFGYTNSGEPKHPLYLSYYHKLIPWGVEVNGIRDGEHICTGYEIGSPGGSCESDGHYLCRQCKQYDIEAKATVI